MTAKPRWQYRFDNYKRAFILLREAMEKETLSQLEQEGTIQRFEYNDGTGLEDYERLP